jgi:hypothetical protein
MSTASKRRARQAAVGTITIHLLARDGRIEPPRAPLSTKERRLWARPRRWGCASPAGPGPCCGPCDAADWPGGPMSAYRYQ